MLAVHNNSNSNRNNNSNNNSQCKDLAVYVNVECIVSKSCGLLKL